jgi:shikimate kinase
MPSLAIEGRPIFVIGFMGTGKSTVGRLLAARLERPFVDLDEEIESEAQATVAEIFAGEGEAKFRTLEASVLERLCRPDDDREAQKAVIAAGGGAPAHGENLERMLAAGVVIALLASPDQILARVGEAATRPLLARFPAREDRRAEVQRLLAQRAPAYARAHLTVDTDGKAPSQVLARILEALGC